MNAPPKPATIRIGQITVHAASGLDARRLADALPRAIEHHLQASLDGGLTDDAAGRADPHGAALSARAVVERLAERVAAAIGEHGGKDPAGSPRRRAR